MKQASFDDTVYKHNICIKDKITYVRADATTDA